MLQRAISSTQPPGSSWDIAAAAAYAAALAPVGTEDTVFRICDAIW
jgi:hypothetical protein